MPGTVTALLSKWRGGEEKALDELSPLVYRELRRIASNLMQGERAGHTLQPTALANEAFLRLCGDVPEVDWQSKAHFLSLAARLMRQVLIQHARSKSAAKRGGSLAVTVSLQEGRVEAPGRCAPLEQLDDALRRLSSFDSRKAAAVEMRYFGGLTVPEIAHQLHVSVATVERDIRSALAWLRRELNP
jgi:RNA polymerase sigma factor (TIGR02999 family)